MNPIFSVQIPHTFIGMSAIAKIGELIRPLAPTKILVISDKGISKAGIVDTVKRHLEDAKCQFDVFDETESEPSISQIEMLGQKVRDNGYDLLIGVGGGSVMDATKVASVIAASDLTVYDLLSGKTAPNAVNKVLVPTTAGTGSEWSYAAVMSDDRANKQTRVVRIPQNLANGVILDPELTRNLPQKITADSGFDALTHAIEAFISAKANIISDMAAQTAIRLIAANLRPAFGKGSKNMEARYNMTVGAALAMHAVADASSGMVHYMNEPLGKKAGIPHGQACAILLPVAMQFNLVANPGKFAQIAEMLGENISGLSLMDAASRSVESVKRLIRDLEMPQSMSAVGITENDIPALVEEVAATKTQVLAETNCRDMSRADIIRIYQMAF
jgi:alcohol dehydrogenase